MDNPFQNQPPPTTPPSGFQVPVETIPLPSQGLIYSTDHPLCNANTVDIKCMTAKEEDLITSRALIKQGLVTTKLIESCVLNKSLQAGSLLSGDRNAILLSIRITGYGAAYTASVQCPQCAEEFSNDFALTGLKIKGLGAKPLAPNLNLFDFILPLSGRKVEFKLLTGDEENELNRIGERTKKLGGQIENNITSRLLYSIVSIDGETDRQKIAQAVNNMPAGDSRALRKYIDQVEPGMDMKQFVECPHCHEQSEVTMPVGIDFFWPDDSK